MYCQIGARLYSRAFLEPSGHSESGSSEQMSAKAGSWQSLHYPTGRRARLYNRVCLVSLGSTPVHSRLLQGVLDSTGAAMHMRLWRVNDANVSLPALEVA